MSAFEQALAALRALREIDDTAELTADQYAALAAFPGWGAVAPVFDKTPPKNWVARAVAFAEEMSGADLTESRRVVDTSFYTPAELVKHMWNLLSVSGFQSGRVLDIGCGTGNFMTHRPHGLDVDYVGIDTDPVATDIARILHPSATILTASVQSADVGSGFAAAIGNVPFSSAHVYESGLSGLPLHGACIRRAARAVRPGGYVVQVTSRHVMDGHEPTLRRALAKYTDLIAAIRLPSGYFRETGTDVVADVLVMRVRPLTAQGKTAGAGWPVALTTESRLDITDGTDTVSVSEYWRDHPELVCGTMVPTGYELSPLKVVSTDSAADVAAAFDTVTALISATAVNDDAPDEHFADVVLADACGRPERSFQLIDDVVYRVEDGQLAEVARPSRELKALIELRDARLNADRERGRLGLP